MPFALPFPPILNFVLLSVVEFSILCKLVLDFPRVISDKYYLVAVIAWEFTTSSLLMSSGWLYGDLPVR